MKQSATISCAARLTKADWRSANYLPLHPPTHTYRRTLTLSSSTALPLSIKYVSTSLLTTSFLHLRLFLSLTLSLRLYVCFFLINTHTLSSLLYNLPLSIHVHMALTLPSTPSLPLRLHSLSNQIQVHTPFLCHITFTYHSLPFNPHTLLPLTQSPSSNRSFSFPLSLFYTHKQYTQM